MAASISSQVFIFLSIFCILSTAHLQSNKDGFISVAISEKGLDFLKDLLIDKAVSSLTPLELTPIEKSEKIPLVGKVHIVLSNIVIYHIDVHFSKIELEDSGIAISASGATANLSMDWKYTYKNWIFEVSDKGKASVQVEDMEVGLTVSLKDQGGNLKLSLLESRCDVEDIDIKLDGGASWLYQGVVDAFTNHIESAVQDAILKKLNNGISQIGSLLQSLPTEIQVDDTSVLNVTFVSDPILTDSSIGFVINGLFIPRNKALAFQNQHQLSQSSIPFYKPAKMIAISLHEDVFNSASSIYYNAGHMHWKVDKMPDQSILNTNEWREIVPQLYQRFPNHDIVLNLSVSAPPFVHIFDDKLETTIYSDVIVDVLLDDEEIIPVACLSLVISASGYAEISRNNLTGSIKLDKFSLSAKWSKVGDLQIDVIEPIMSEILEDVLLPLLNSRLTRGFRLPLIHGFTLHNAEIIYSDSVITVSSDVTFQEDHHLPQEYSISNIFAFHLGM